MSIFYKSESFVIKDLINVTQSAVFQICSIAEPSFPLALTHMQQGLRNNSTVFASPLLLPGLGFRLLFGL